MLKPFLPTAVEYDPIRISRRWCVCAATMLFAALWAFWPTICQLVSRWSDDPQYSHGFFVPAIAVFIAWCRREDVLPSSSTPQNSGLLWIAAGFACYVAGSHIAFDWLQGFAILPVLTGIALVLGGQWLLAVVWPSVLFLLFMIPLPFRFEVAMAQPLQQLASRASVFALQTLGVVATRNGNLLYLENYVLGVAEACSGLRMLVVFFALSTAFAVLSRRSWIHNLILISSAVPIALICNVGRIVITGLLYLTAGEEIAGKVFHDFAGWLMMPSALLMMWLEMKYVDLVIRDEGPGSSGSGQRAATVFANPLAGGES